MERVNKKKERVMFDYGTVVTIKDENTRKVSMRKTLKLLE